MEAACISCARRAGYERRYITFPQIHMAFEATELCAINAATHLVGVSFQDLPMLTQIYVGNLNTHFICTFIYRVKHNIRRTYSCSFTWGWSMLLKIIRLAYCIQTNIEHGCEISARWEMSVFLWRHFHISYIN